MASEIHDYFTQLSSAPLRTPKFRLILLRTRRQLRITKNRLPVGDNLLNLGYLYRQAGHRGSRMNDGTTRSKPLRRMSRHHCQRVYRRRTAHRLADTVDVTLFEAERRLGGHTDSHSVWVEDKVYTIDTGFVAFHPSGHAGFCEWLTQIGVPTQRTDLSFSVRADHDNLEYSTIGWRTFFSSAGLLLSLKHWRLLWDWHRFQMEAPKAANLVRSKPATISVSTTIATVL